MKLNKENILNLEEFVFPSRHPERSETESKDPLELRERDFSARHSMKSVEMTGGGA